MIWLAVALGLGVTVFGASSTAALLTVGRAALADAVSRRLRGAPESLDWLYETERELAGAAATTGLGVTLLAAALSAVLAILTGGLPVWALALLLLVVAVPFVLFSGYVLPRWLTDRRANRVADLVRPLLRPWARLLAVLLPEPVRRHAADVRAIWREGAAGALGRSEELVLVGNVITFAQRMVRDVMTPRTELVAIPEESNQEELTQAFVQSGYSRIPVYRGTIDEIVGMVHVFDVLKIKPGERAPLRPVGAVPGTRTCGDVLLDMQRERRHLAVVLDEFGGTLGIVTLEDLLGAMVGEIFDEPDGAARPTAATPLVWEADGTAELGDLESRFGVTLPGGAARTIGGRLVELAGRVPRAGERFALGGLELDVVAAAPTRIERLLVRRAGTPAVTLDRPGA
jgi:CBS domain containing-hemolysin-like protein